MTENTTETTERVVAEMDLEEPAKSRILKPRGSIEGRRGGVPVPMMGRDVLTNPDYDPYDMEAF